MPSPFPGMDPFLEAPAYFGGLHDSMITYLREFLQAHLPEPYFADIADRVWVTTIQHATEAVVVHVPHDEHREPSLEIFTRTEDGERLVTTVEVLSQSNKTPGEHGRDLYLRKQREILEGRVNLVEIDLLRGGQHTTAVPVQLARAQAGGFDYHVCVHRLDNLEDYFVYPILLAQRLPAIRIPLLPGDADVAVDVQTVFDRCYDSGPYRRRVRYADMMAVPPLTPDQASWIASAGGRGVTGLQEVNLIRLSLH